MTQPLATSFRNTVSLEEAETLRDYLKENDIPARISKNEGDLDYVFQGEAPTNKFEVFIHEDHKEAAEKLLSERARKDLDQISSDHYLFTFSNDDLLNVLIEKNEWNETFC